MDGGASILAFITCGLKSIQVVHGVISSVRDGPQILRHLTHGVLSLQQQLEQIRDDPTLSNAPSSHIKALDLIVERCNDDMKDFENRVSKLNISPSERLHGKFWKRLKFVFVEKDMASMLSIVSGHIDRLNLQINIRQMGSLATITNQNSQLKSTVDGLVQSMTAVPSISSTQASEISTNLAHLTQLFGTLAARLPMRAEDENQNATETSANGERSENSADAEVWQSIERLSKLVDEKERTIASDEAGDIVDALESLLKGVARDAHATAAPAGGQRHRDESRQIRRVAAHFVDSEAVRLNGMCLVRYAATDKDIATQEARVQTVDTSYGKATFTSVVRARRQIPRRATQSQRSLERHETVSTVALLVKGLGQSTFIKASILRGTAAGVFISIAPCVSVSRVVPNESDVFQCIRDGRLDSLQQLLRDGRASIHDRDEFGASLLHHAYDQPDIVGFLLQNGADVNDIAVVTSVHRREHREEPSSPLGLIYSEEPGHGGDRKQVERSLRSLKHMLAAGGDVTLEPAFLTTVLLLFPHEHLRTIVDEAIPFFDLHDTFLTTSAFEIACENPFAERIKFLASRGAKLTLHFLLINLRLLQDQWYDDFESIKCLINLGADVSAVSSGQSCSEVAYSNEKHGSWAGDAWDAALVACGYDFRDFRKGYPRKARYEGSYTRAMFENIWSGMEHLCPYYDDQDWYPDGLASSDDSDADFYSLASGSDEDISGRQES